MFVSRHRPGERTIETHLIAITLLINLAVRRISRPAKMSSYESPMTLILLLCCTTGGCRGKDKILQIFFPCKFLNIHLDRIKQIH